MDEELIRLNEELIRINKEIKFMENKITNLKKIAIVILSSHIIILILLFRFYNIIL